MAEMNYPARLDSHVSVDAQPTNPSMPLPRVGTGSSFDPHNFTRGMSDSILTLNQREMQDIIKDYYDRMPSHLKTIFYDVMILYAKKDQEAATKFRDHLQNDIILDRERRVTAVLYDDEELVSLSGSKVQSLEYGFQRCTFAFIFMTKSFFECAWSVMTSEGCLIESIQNKDKEWCVVPVHTVKPADFSIPMMLNTLKGLNYFKNDDFYRRALSGLIGDKVKVRLDKNRDHLTKQYNFAYKIKIEDYYKDIAEERAIKQNQEILDVSRKMEGFSIGQPSDPQNGKGDPGEHMALDDKDLTEDSQPLPWNDTSLNNKLKVGTGGEKHRKTTDSACLYAEVENLYRSELSKRIGCIEVSGNSLGTCFRVGSKYVMTAYHVVEDILEDFWKEVYERLTLDERKSLKWTKSKSLCDGRWSLKDLIQKSSMGDKEKAKLRDIEQRFIKRLQIKFSLVKENQDHVNGTFSGDVAFASADSDVAILELEGLELPEPIKLMNTNSQIDDIHIMGYSRGGYLKYDPKCAVIKKKEDLSVLVQKATAFFVQQGCNIDMVKEDYKLCDLSPDQILFHCSESTAHGASGSPLLVSSDPPEAAGMLLRGYPKFYYNLIHKNKEMGQQPDLLIEAGISMEQVHSLLKENSLDDLANELFPERSSK